MKKRLKTDGVDGLLEIVKAVQQGEDPEEMLKRKEAQRLEEEREAQRLAQEQAEAERAAQKEAEEAAAREAEAKRQAKKEARKAKRSKSEEDKQGLTLILQTAADKLSLSLASLTERRKAAKKKAEEKSEAEEIRQEEAAEQAEETGSAPITEPAVSAESMERVSSTQDGDTDKVRLEEQQSENQQSEAQRSEEQQSENQQSQVEDEFDFELSEDEKIFERLLERNGISKEEIRAEQEAAAKEAALQKLSASEETQQPEKKKKEISFSGIRDYALELIENLKQRGISRKECIMLLAGVILACMVIAFVWNGIGSFLEQRQKSEHVTADRGLTVTVESEPEEWCSSYPIALKFKASGGSVKQVTVNGEDYTPDETGIITIETGEWLLEAAVTLEDGTQLAARIEIPKLDDQVPVVTAERSENTIVLTAADSRSAVKNIYYGTVSSYTPEVLPNYQIYKEPLNYTADTLYYFYAEDTAGNRSVPMKTTMEAAESIELNVAELSLFPGESRKLQVVTVPENALLKEVRYESTDASVASVDGNGVITAGAEGIASIKVSAQSTGDSAEISMTCTVTVSKSRSVTVSTIGDCTLGTDAYFNTMTNFNAFEAVNGKAYFFKNVKEILEADDVTFANLEGTFTTENTREMKEYAFKGDPSYTEILQEGSIEVVTLANNHSSDYGAQSLEDTKTYLTEAEIDYCIGDTIVMKEVNGIQMAFIGIYVLNDGLGRETQVRETIAEAKAKGAQLIITAFHWGSEKATAPDETQTTLAHLAVDCGANLVVGHHPHVLQGIEKYNGVYIVYSLGNFCFGGNSTPSDKDTMIFQQTFTISDGTILDDDQIEVIPCSISSTSNYNNYQPTPAQGTEADRIMEKINGYSAVYGQTYTASAGA